MSWQVKHLALRPTEGGAEIKSARISRRGSRTQRGRNRLLNRESLDGRTITAKTFDRLVEAIHADLGGDDQLSAIELRLVETFCGSSIVVDHLNTRILAGAEINNALISAYAQAASAMVRIVNKLGTGRRAKLVPDLDTFLALRSRARAERDERDAKLKQIDAQQNEPAE